MVFVTSQTLSFRLALAILWGTLIIQDYCWFCKNFWKIGLPKVPFPTLMTLLTRRPYPLINDLNSDLHGCWNATEILISQKFECIDLCHLNRTDDFKGKCQWNFCTDLNLDSESEMKILYGLWFLLFLSTLEVILEKYVSCMPRRVFVDSIPKIRTDKKTVPMAQRMSNMLPF